MALIHDNYYFNDYLYNTYLLFFTVRDIVPLSCLFYQGWEGVAINYSLKAKGLAFAMDDSDNTLQLMAEYCAYIDRSFDETCTVSIYLIKRIVIACTYKFSPVLAFLEPGCKNALKIHL